MIAALIAIGAAVVALISYAWWTSATIRSCERETANARVTTKDAEGKLAAMTSDRDAHKARADYQERRANALDQELDTVADSGDPAGARGRVLSRLTAADATAGAHGDNPGAVPASGQGASVAGERDDALLKPGD